VGETLTVDLVDSNGTSSSTITYQWQAGASDIADATSETYTITDAEAGQSIQVLLSYVDDDGYDEHVTSGSVYVAPLPNAGGGNFRRGSLGDNDSVPVVSCDTVYSSTSDLESAATRRIAAGTTLCLADGTYSGLELDFGGAGTANAPVTVAAENSGQAIIGGEVSVRMSGEYAVLQGLVFEGGQTGSSDLIQTRDGSGGDHCNNCRITELAIVDVSSDDSGQWLNIYGQNNRIDHSWFAGKINAGVLLGVNREIPSGQTAADLLPNNTIIDHNYFGDRPPTDGKAYAESSDNGYEAIRIGTSFGHAFDSNVVVEYNYFERIEAEAEIISNKAGNNQIINNTFRDNYGSVTTRHGANTTIAGNVILGDGHPFAGGLRIIDDGHRVVNNYIQGVRYKNTRFHGGIVIHNGNSSTTNGYQDVFNVLIAHNTVVDSVNSFNVNGGRQNNNPEDIYFVNNIIAGGIGPIITYASDGLPAASTFEGNYVEGQSFSDDVDLTSTPGFNTDAIALAKDFFGLSRPDASNSSALSAAQGVDIGGFATISDDLDGQARPTDTQSGADHISADPAIKGLLAPDDVGPMSFRPNYSQGYVLRLDVENGGFDLGTADGWNFTTPATIAEDTSDVFSGATARLSGDGRISQDVTVQPDTNYTLSAFAKGAIRFGAQVGAAGTSVEENNSDYRLTTVSFNSGAESSVTLFAEVDDGVTVSVPIAGADFKDFTGDSFDPDWTVIEGGTLGQVQATGNSATGASGALKFRLNGGGNERGGMGVTQELTDILPDTDYTLEAYVLNKRGFDVTATIGVYEGTSTTVLASKVLDFAALKAAGAEQSEEDGFLRDAFTFNSGEQTNLTLFVTYDVNTVYADGGVQADTELWVDDISMTYQGAPVAGSVAYLDEVRLVAHGN